MGALAAIAVGALLLMGAFTSSAKADQTVSYIGGNGSTFATTDGGWVPSTNYSGLCLAGVTCPTMNPHYEATGGTGGAADGYIRID